MTPTSQALLGIARRKIADSRRAVLHSEPADAAASGRRKIGGG